jgi:hypothetical protein
MKERVNIQYSVDMEELPIEVERLLNKAEKRLATCYKDLQALLKTYNHQILMTTACTHDIGTIREGFINVDFLLNDASSIINGFVSHQLGDGEGSMEAEEALKANPYVDTEQLAEKIQEFKESFTK